MESILKKKNASLTKKLLAIVIGLIVFVVLLKPQVDDYFEEKNLQVAIDVCGEKDKVKKINNKGLNVSNLIVSFEVFRSQM